MRVSMLTRTSWDIVASVVLQRAPIIASPMSPIERRYQDMLLKVEKESSLLNDHELKSKKDQLLLAKKAELEASGKDLSELEGELEVTNLMKEQEWNARADRLVKNYKLNERNDGEKDEKSLQRLLDRQLVLVVRQKFGQKQYASPWKLPEIEHRQGETLRQTAERCLGEVVSGDLAVQIQGNAPVSIYTFRYPKPVAQKKNKNGAKIFFYNAVMSPKSDFQVNKSEIADFGWLCAEEFNQRVTGDYRKSVHTCFLE
ncbi:unnamed protein product, partial [Mesorhabditis belari]|uniref:Large ribosomal subunit protein mL46 n=1 Tax=Mesorhabditis belari TaxID=2138241 RepID=A0AAF3FGX0_9BILA